MINASGASMPQQSQMPQAGAGVPAASATTPTVPATPQASAATTQPLTASTTPPAAANAPVGGTSSGSGLKKPKKKLPWKMIAGAIVLILVIVGALAGYFLSQTSQDVRQQASQQTYNSAGDPCSTEGQIICGDNRKQIQCGGGVWRPLSTTCDNPGEVVPSQTQQVDGDTSLCDPRVQECDSAWIPI